MLNPSQDRSTAISTPRPTRPRIQVSSTTSLVFDSLVAGPKDKFNSHNYVLIKNSNATLDVYALSQIFEQFRGFEEIVTIPNSNNIYIKFADNVDLQAMFDLHSEQLKAAELEASIVNKLPLDLNSHSKVILVTFYSLKIEIDVFIIKGLFAEFRGINRASMFKKKNYQMLIEFESIEEAVKFKDTMHNKEFKGLFFIKVQYTKKNLLKILNSNKHEFDFTKDTRLSCFETSIELGVTSMSMAEPTACNNNENVGKNVHNVKPVANSYVSVAEKSERVTGLLVAGLGDEITHKQLFNVFSLYGELVKIEMNREAKSALVVYVETQTHLRTAQILNGIVLLGSKLEFSFFKSNGSISSHLVGNQHELLTDMSFENFPTNHIEISNLARSVTSASLKTLIENTESVEGVQKTGESSFICTFATRNAAVDVLCKLRNTNFCGKSLKIKFVTEASLIALEKKNLKAKPFSMQNLNARDEIANRLPLQERKLWEHNLCSRFVAL